MNNGFMDIIDCLQTAAADPFQRYILKKEILREIPTSADIDAIRASKWYVQLASEQQENGSWGRFHTQDTKDKTKRKFVTTEHALRRAFDLSLGKDDPIVGKALGLMEHYLQDEERWTDNDEHHYGWEISFKALISANMSRFDPDNPLLRTKREICALNLSKAFIGNKPDEVIWENENRKSNEILLRLWMVYPIWLLQNNAYLGDDLQRRFLSWIWKRKEGIYYITGIPPADKRVLEDNTFFRWLAGLENLSGFSLFPEMMTGGTADHLYNEIKRLMTGDIKLPPAQPIIGHYAEKWTTGNARKTDIMLRIMKVLAKC